MKRNWITQQAFESALCGYVLAYPILLPLAFFVTWLAGRLSLGYWPRPSLDDPKYIGTWVDVPYIATCLLEIIGLPLFATLVLVIIYRAWTDKSQRKRFLSVSVLAVVFMIASIWLIRQDPMGIVGWFMD